MDFNSRGARRGARFSAAPLPPPSPPLQLQFHDIFGKLRNLEITKSQGMEGNLSSRCFKAHWEMPSDFNVHLSRDAAGLEPTPAARRCPPPSPGVDGGHHGQSLFCSTAPNPELWLMYRNWSCPFQLDPGALVPPAPSPSLSSAAAGAELPVVLLSPSPTLPSAFATS